MKDQSGMQHRGLSKQSLLLGTQDALFTLLQKEWWVTFEFLSVDEHEVSQGQHSVRFE